jgi:hypothetical protein
MTLLINHSVSEGIYVESLLGAAFIFCAEGKKKKRVVHSSLSHFPS